MKTKRRKDGGLEIADDLLKRLEAVAGCCDGATTGTLRLLR